MSNQRSAMSSSDLNLLFSAAGLGRSEHPLGDSDHSIVPFAMSDNEMDVSIPDTPDGVDISDEERQRISLNTYLNAVPYTCEPEQEMQVKLEYIIARIVISIEARDWHVLTAWDGLLQWYADASFRMSSPFNVPSPIAGFS